MMAFWSWHSTVSLLQKVPPRTMIINDTPTQERIESTHSTTTNNARTEGSQ